MKQQALWAESEARGNPKQSERLAKLTQSSRVVELHRWQNKLTGETCRLTMHAFARLNCVAKRRAYDTPRQSLNAWVYDGPAGRSIEGDGLHWLLKQQAKNGRTDLQFKEKVAQAWTHSVLILARYHQGWGVKRIAADLGVSSTGIWKMLVESGIDTGARRNYVPSRKVGQYKARGRLSYQNRMRDQGQRLKKRLMVRIWIAMKNQSVNATGTFAAVGCSAEHLRAHLESKFEPGMMWNNYGEWHVDHIRPCASFDLSDPKQLAECFNWSNLQPLWAKENISKGAKYA
jgi:hypothetical protein